LGFGLRFFGFDHDGWSFGLARNNNGGIWGYPSFSVDGLILGELNFNFRFRGIILRRI
jgi:hypothetical protein